jgi:hypothetical protein
MSTFVLFLNLLSVLSFNFYPILEQNLNDALIS